MNPLKVKDILYTQEHLCNPFEYRDGISDTPISIRDQRVSIIVKSIFIGLLTLGIGGVIAFYYFTAQHKVTRYNEYLRKTVGNKPIVKINVDKESFWKEFKILDFLKTLRITDHYHFVISNKPDFVFYSVFTPGNYKNGTWSTPQLKGDFKSIFICGENVKPDMTKCDWAFSFTHDEDINNQRHFRLPLYKYQFDISSLEKRKIDAETISKIKKNKTKFCNFIYSAENPFRNKFFDKLNKYKPVDAPGKARNNMPPIGHHKDALLARKAKDWAQEKQDFLDSYKFTIAFENTSAKGYTTEKIVGPMERDSIPIYWGNPQIEKDFNGKSFIHLKPEEYALDEDQQIDLLVKKVIEIDQNDDRYEAYLKEPWFPGNKPTKYSDNKVILQQFRKIFAGA